MAAAASPFTDPLYPAAPAAATDPLVQAAARDAATAVAADPAVQAMARDAATAEATRVANQASQSLMTAVCDYTSRAQQIWNPPIRPRHFLCSADYHTNKEALEAWAIFDSQLYLVCTIGYMVTLAFHGGISFILTPILRLIPFTLRYLTQVAIWHGVRKRSVTAGSACLGRYDLLFHSIFLIIWMCHGLCYVSSAGSNFLVAMWDIFPEVPLGYELFLACKMGGLAGAKAFKAGVDAARDAGGGGHFDDPSGGAGAGAGVAPAGAPRRSVPGVDPAAHRASVVLGGDPGAIQMTALGGATTPPGDSLGSPPGDSPFARLGDGGAAPGGASPV